MKDGVSGVEFVQAEFKVEVISLPFQTLLGQQQQPSIFAAEPSHLHLISSSGRALNQRYNVHIEWSGSETATKSPKSPSIFAFWLCCIIRDAEYLPAQKS